MKKVSIITVCLDAAKTIERTIQSVLNQSCGFENIEYIIIDGGSTDGTIDIINKYKENISCFISESDRGIYDAMNKGISAASGEIVGILNADDWYDLMAIENVMECFDANDTDIVYGEVWRVEKDETISEAKRVYALCDTWYLMTVWHPATFVKREIYRRLGGFSTDYEIAADYEFILRCLSEQIKFTYLDKKLTYFRSGGVSNRRHRECAEETNRISLKYIEKAPDKRRVLDENDYRTRSAVFKEKCDQDPASLIGVLPCIREGRIVIWGTGIWGRKIIILLKKLGIEIAYLVDTDVRKMGEHLLGMEIRDPETLREGNFFVIVAVRRIEQTIKNRMTDLGIGRDRYLFLEEWMRIVSEMEEKENI